MDKLINLLNKYDDACEYNIIDGEMKRRVKNFDNEQNTWKQVVWYTKQFGFIKWLVDNDKIEKNYKEGLPAITKNGFLLEGETALLMLLSISDTPIEDLISVLK